MFSAEENQKIVQKMQDSTFIFRGVLQYVLDIFEIFAEVCFPSERFRKPLPLNHFQDLKIHTTPTKSTINIASANLGEVRSLLFSYVPTCSIPPVERMPLVEEASLVGMVRGWEFPKKAVTV